jgi:hypothetical protein
VSSRSCKRVELSTQTKRRLWSESGGYCQNPSCARYLFADGCDIDFAEMAHVIPASARGPRHAPVDELSEDQRAHPDNIAVLCASCHSTVDKAPDSYPAELIRQWKQRHRDLLKRALGIPKYSARPQARGHIAPLLAANRLIHIRYAPKPGQFSEATAEQWHRHVRSTILPNNRDILRVLETNRHLLTAAEIDTVDVFALHVRELESRHLLNDWTAGSTRFPDSLSSILDLDR